MKLGTEHSTEIHPQQVSNGHHGALPEFPHIIKY
jgi:hypothetical protein